MKTYLLLFLFFVCGITSQGQQLENSDFFRHIYQYDSLLNINADKAKVALDLLNNYNCQTNELLTCKVLVLYCNTRWYVEKGECDSALLLAGKARALAHEKNNQMWAAVSMGAAHRCARHIDSALSYYFLAEKLANTLHDTSALIRSYFYLGHLHSELGKFEKAGNFYTLSNELAKATNDDNFLARTTLALASNLADRGYLRQALPVLHLALHQCKKANLVRPTATACNNLGLLYKELGQYGLAAKYFKESLRIQTALNNMLEMATEHNNLAMVLIYEGKYKDAIDLLLKAEKLLEQLNNRYMLPEVYHNLAVCYAQISDFKMAYTYKEWQKNLSDSLRGIEMLKHTEQLQEEFEAEKRQLEISNLKQENEVKELKNKASIKQRNVFIALAIGLFGVALLVFFYLRQRVRNARQTTNQNQLIHRQQMEEVLRKSELQSIHTMLETQEKERKRIAEDLHDRLGSMLSTIKLQFSHFTPKEQVDKEQQFNKVSHLLDDACEEIRLVSHNLVSGVLSTFGLIPALNDLTTALKETSTLHIDMHVHGMETRIESDVEINMYRIFQELFNNTIRHAKATHIEIDISRFDNQLVLIYSDDGVGFDTAVAQSGIGIKNMYSRLNKLGGSLHIDSGRGNGSTFIFTIQL
ncbi:MAG: sensor histidine kinase [Bacteroidota bacterium]